MLHIHFHRKVGEGTRDHVNWKSNIMQATDQVEGMTLTLMNGLIEVIKRD